MTRPFNLLAALLLASTLAAGCGAPDPLGDGTLQGHLPRGWHDSGERPEGALLRVTADSVPLPWELLVHRIDAPAGPSEASTRADWEVVDETTEIATTKLIGDEWEPLHRTVRVYRGRLGGMALEARVDVRFDRGKAEAFLRSLRPAGDHAATPEAARTAPFRVAVLSWGHETCTFCPGGDVTVQDWTRQGEPRVGVDALLNGGSFVRGFVDRAREYGGVELVGLTSPRGVFGGSSRSWNTREAFEHFMGRIEDDLREQGPFDGVHLALHGAMAVREVPRPEAEIARRVRRIVGPDAVITGTFDLHGNEDAEFLRWADGAFVTKRYPHYDAYLQGERAARYMVLVMRGEYTPAKATRKPPVLTATVLQWTGQSPSMDIMERARRWEARHDDAYVSVFYGFPWSDVPDVGTTVHVMTDGDQELAERIADDMADYIWRVRETFAVGEFPTPDEAADRAVDAIAAGATPVVLADYSDRPGDATWILRELIDRDVSGVLYAALTDEPAISALAERGAEPGDSFDMEVGGYTGPQAGEPVRIRGTLRYLGPAWDYYLVAAVEHGDGNLLFLTPAYTQVRTPEELQQGWLGDVVELDDYRVFVVKSRVHFRRGFDETGFAKTILVVDAPGPWVGTTRLDALEYEHAPIDRLYPFGGARWP